MTQRPDEVARALTDRIEAAIHRDVGRGMNPVFGATQGGLFGAAAALVAFGAPRIGLITGFFVPNADPPAAETDGPAGAALMARAFVHAGLSCRLATDTTCRSACRAALDAAGAIAVPIDAAAPDQPIEALIDLWRSSAIDWVIAIERCGPAADGNSRNMRGTDISAHAAPLHRLFGAGPWRSIAIGDGGNEIGMGRVAPVLIAQHVPLGEAIGCVVPADFLITAGVSHWGAYAMLAALAVLRPEWSGAMLASVAEHLDQAVVEAMVRDGPAVDGVSLRHEATIDALDFAVHHAVLRRILAVIGEPPAADIVASNRMSGRQ
ncbi:glutamate cyclase domain-containing protein [Rhodopila sp.]|uniref:glutamate cyclase domain-containing protein n=1 Tax=Rhodopila sp. TaxID=2480087 RepID=UPI003D14ABAB